MRGVVSGIVWLNVFWMVSASVGACSSSSNSNGYTGAGGTGAGSGTGTATQDAASTMSAVSSATTGMTVTGSSNAQTATSTSSTTSATVTNSSSVSTTGSTTGDLGETSNGSTTTTNATSSTGTITGGPSSSGAGGVSSTGSTGGQSTTGALGDDNPWGDVQGGQQGWASRYWDCCKPSCGWSGNASNPVHSCDINDNDIGVDDMGKNACELNGQSGDFTCHHMAPWAYSTKVSFGFAAVNGVGCGTCFHIQFTGTSSHGAGEGVGRLNGKSMIVMATNIGGIEQGQFDLLIPGGGVGLLNGCSGQWGVDNSQLGAQYGGFMTECAQQNAGNYEGTKSCVRSKCETIFQAKGFDELYDGCMWFLDWYEAADNPDIRYEQIECPQELIDASH